MNEKHNVTKTLLELQSRSPTRIIPSEENIWVNFELFPLSSPPKSVSEPIWKKRLRYGERDSGMSEALVLVSPQGGCERAAPPLEHLAH